MKRLTVCILLLCPWLAIGKDNVSLRGHIINRLADSVKVTYYFTAIIYEPIEKIAVLDKDGNFSIGFTVPDGYTKIELSNGGESTEIFVEPGTDLQLSVDGKRFDSSLHYEGKGEDIANFVAKQVLEERTITQFAIKNMSLYGKLPEDYVNACAALEKEEIDFINTEGKNLPAPFREYYTVYYRYMMYDMMELYPHHHEAIVQKTQMVKDIPREDYAVIDQVPEAYDDKYLSNPGYAGYLVNLPYGKIMAENAKIGKKEMPGDATLNFAYAHMPPRTAEYYVGQQIANSVERAGEEKLQRNIDSYKAHFPDSKNLALLQQAMAIRKTVAVGKPAPDFTIITPEGKQMKLSDLRGKVVYLDFWSSGCVPCIAEMPYAKKIHEYFKNKPVAFVNVCLDTKDATWKYALRKYDVEGINCMEERGEESETAKKYGVKGIPAYYLLDRNGKFAIIENLARPSDDSKLKKQIEQVLTEAH